MKLIFETEQFRIATLENPHVSRTDGGHIFIDPVVAVEDRTFLTEEQAKELMKLTMVAGEAMRVVMNKHGVDIARINYQDNGNWKQELHIHLYGRARSATEQKWGTLLRFLPTKDEFEKTMNGPEPLHDEDISAIKAEIVRLLETPKYKFF